MHSTLIVARMDAGSSADVAKLFADFDATEMPHLMGTRRRQLFSYRGLYFHLQDFDADDGGERDRAGQDRPALRADQRRPEAVHRGLRPGDLALAGRRHGHPLLPLAGVGDERGADGRSSPASSVVAPGGVGAKEFWDLLTDGRTATRRITFFDPAPVPVPGRRRGRLRPGGARAEPAGGPADGPGRPVRRGRARGGGRGQRPRARPASTRTGSAVSIGSAVGAHHGPGARSTGSSATAAGAGWSTTRYAVAAPVRLLRAQLVRRRGGLGGRRRGAGDAWSPPAAPPASTRSGYARRADPGGLAPTSMIAGATDAPISPITVACFDAIKATTPRNDDPEHASRPFDAHPQRLRARRGRRGVRAGGAASAPGGAARTSTPRSPATPPAATPST